MIWQYLQIIFVIATLTMDPIKDFRSGLDRDLYPRGAVMALIDVESCGNELAQRSRFYGLLQMSPAYLQEIGLEPKHVMNKYGAISAFYIMQKRYRVRRKGMSELAIPIFHKGGPGVWSRWRKLVRSGLGDMEAVRRLKNPGLERFLRKYSMARIGNAHWCGN